MKTLCMVHYASYPLVITTPASYFFGMAMK